MQKLKQAKFQDREEGFKEFEVLYQTFKLA
jgi:hypothetical protein